VAERQLPKLNVAGSIPVSRSNDFAYEISVPQLVHPSRSRGIVCAAVACDIVGGARNHPCSVRRQEYFDLCNV
jgi:hypothetical protein